MGLSGLPKTELESSLRDLKRLYEAAAQEYQEKYLHYQEVGRELVTIQDSLKGFRTSIATVEKALGLSSEQIPLPQGEVKRGAPPDATETVMRLVAAHHEEGGITFDQILNTLRSEGHKTKRDYLHTILNRKKNYQKKLTKQNGKWLLTDKGKEEVGK